MKRLLSRDAADTENSSLLKSLQEELNAEELDDDFLIRFRNSLNDRYEDSEMIEDLKEVVEYNMKIESGEKEGEKVVLEMDDKIRIEDPFYDETGRGQVDPVDYYGKEKIDRFINKYKKNVKKDKEDI